jgi:hypothetical protein
MDTGEILAIVHDIADDSTGNGYYAAILGLAGDFDRDWRIGSSDLAILLGAWGETDNMEVDLDESGEVDAADLAILIGGLWSGSTQVPLELPCSGEACLPNEASMTAGAEMTLASILEMFGFGSIEAFVTAVQSYDEDEVNSLCEMISAAIHAAGGDS